MKTWPHPSCNVLKGMPGKRPPSLPHLPGIASAIGILTLMLSAAPLAAAENLGSVNLHSLASFTISAEASGEPVRVLSLGDSLQAPHRSIGRHLYPSLRSNIGFSGIALPGQTPNLALSQLSGGASVILGDSTWWQPSFEIPAGGSTSWSNQTSATGSLRATRAGIHYIATPHGGMLNVSVSSNGGSWMLLESLDCFSPAAQGRFASWPLATGDYRLRVDGLSGTNRVLGPEIVNTNTSGLVQIFLQRDGVNLSQILGTPPAVLNAVLSNLNPHLVVWHMKELADLNFDQQLLSNRLDQLEAVFRSAIPRAAVIYIGTPFEARDQASDHTRTQNRVVREAAIRNGRTYVDCMTPFVSYEAMQAAGHLDDAVHPSNLCYQEISRKLWNELGFFALRAPKTLGILQQGQSVILRWNTTNTVMYQMEGSTNLTEWDFLEGTAGGGGGEFLSTPTHSHLSRFGFSG